MSTLLLIAIYIAFIGLGVPDSLFGTAWPAIYGEFKLPISFGSFATVITCLGTVTSSLMSARIIRRFGTRNITLASTALTALAILGMSASGNFLVFCLFAIPLGLGAGAIDTALNNYVSLHYSSAQMNFLHCFYGIGITVSPLILARMLSGENGWRDGYSTAFHIQLAITAIILLSMPLWKKVSTTDENEGFAETETRSLSIRQLWNTKYVKLTWLIFWCSVALEMSCAGWGCTYLVEYKCIVIDKSAQIVTFYFAGIAVGRFVSGLLAMKFSNWTIIKSSCWLLGLGISGLILAPNIAVTTISFLAIGIGNGPMFPNLTYLTPSIFGKEYSSSVMGSQFGVSNISMMIMPLICGVLGQYFGMWIFPFFILILYLALAYGIWKLIVQTNRMTQ